jgi:cytochrome c oxidase cbb3-type subunit 3
VYNFRCYFCHGYSGDAKTLAASFLNPKPRNFNETSPTKLSRNRMIDAVTHGKVGTAMKGFSKTLSADEISLVVDFVRKEFMVNQARNTFYHTKANGWENHQRYKDAFPFATGEIPLDAPDASLSASEIKGRALFMASCVTCHDRARVNDEGALWNAYAVSFPRNQYSHKEGKASEGLTSVGNVSDVDTVSAATVYAKHDIAPVIPDLSDEERAGEKLFQSNCAFCHGADGTGKNWIGSFLQPNPRNLTDAIFMNTMSRQRLRQVIRDGLENSTMPAWKNVLSAEQIDNIVSYVNRAFHSLKNP